jgi:hypothetical protein
VFGCVLPGLGSADSSSIAAPVECNMTHFFQYATPNVYEDSTSYELVLIFLVFIFHNLLISNYLFILMTGMEERHSGRQEKQSSKGEGCDERVCS